MSEIFANVKIIIDTKKVSSASFVFYFQLHDFSDEEILITGGNWCPVNSRQQDKQVGFMLNVDLTGLKERQVLT